MTRTVRHGICGHASREATLKTAFCIACTIMRVHNDLGHDSRNNVSFGHPLIATRSAIAAASGIARATSAVIGVPSSSVASASWQATILTSMPR
jgi:hypothetical protein